MSLCRKSCLELLAECILHPRKQQWVVQCVQCCSVPSFCSSQHGMQTLKGHQIAHRMCAHACDALGEIRSQSWILSFHYQCSSFTRPQKCWQLWSFQVLAYNWGCQALTSKSVSPQIHKLINKHLHVIMQKDWWRGGVGAHSFLPQNSWAMPGGGWMLWCDCFWSFPSFFTL